MTSIRRDAPALTLLVLMFVLAAWAWPLAPDVVPTHWGISGEPDGWGGKAVGLLLMPAVALGTWLLMVLLPRLDPGRVNYANFAGAYAVLRNVLVAFFALTHAGIVAAALGHDFDMGRLVAPATGLLFIVLGGLMGKIRPNWFVGIRTPWTLTSKRAWVRTHRLGGWLFVGLGALVLALGLFQPPLAYGVLLVGALGMTAAMFAYSWWVWRDDPDRQHPGGTTPAG